MIQMRKPQGVGYLSKVPQLGSEVWEVHTSERKMFWY